MNRELKIAIPKFEFGLKQLLLLAFALSGMTVMIYEVVWIRPLQLIFGSTTYTVSIIFSTFMLGLAVGSMMMGKFVDRIKDLPRTYAQELWVRSWERLLV